MSTVSISLYLFITMFAAFVVFSSDYLGKGDEAITRRMTGLPEFRGIDDWEDIARYSCLVSAFLFAAYYFTNVGLSELSQYILGDWAYFGAWVFLIVGIGVYFFTKILAKLALKFAGSSDSSEGNQGKE